MEQHPIPQQISSYQFRLVGDMTLKQFFQLAGGILVGLIFYSSPLLPIIKWPFAIGSAILGVGLAFMPLEGRPLEKWIFAFFRAVYSPTLYYWKKTNPNTKYFLDEQGATSPQITKQEEAVLQNYLGIKNPANAPSDKLESEEKNFLQKFASMLMGQPAAQNTAATVPTNQVAQPTATQTIPQPNQTPQPAAQPNVGGASNINIPQTAPIKITPVTQPKLVTQETTTPDIATSKVMPVVVGNEMVSTKEAIFSLEAAPPNPPTIPNVVVGQVVSDGGKIVEGAIIEIRDQMGRPVRALKSNRLGHFIIVTPLDNGKYDVMTEKEGLEFHPVSFNAIGNIVPPILIAGKKIVN